LMYLSIGTSDWLGSIRRFLIFGGASIIWKSGL
jgi:hypothetical protein